MTAGSFDRLVPPRDRKIPPDQAARCVACGERLHATHQAGCREGDGEVIHASTLPPIVRRDPGPDRPPLEDLEETR